MELIIKCNDQDIEELFKNRFPDMDKIREDFWRENENGKLKDEIQDFKLENDRLLKRDRLMWKALVAIGCNGTCNGCMLEDKPATCQTAPTKKELACSILKELEDL